MQVFPAQLRTLKTIIQLGAATPVEIAGAAQVSQSAVMDSIKFLYSRRLIEFDSWGERRGKRGRIPTNWRATADGKRVAEAS